jgi:hypothetical protein
MVGWGPRQQSARAPYGLDMIDRRVKQRPFPRADESGERGVTVGGNLAVRDAAPRDLLAFLKKSF